MKNRNIVILGGDNRQRYLSQILKSEFEKLYDINSGSEESVLSEVSKADIIVFPIPVSKTRGLIYTDNSDLEISKEKVFNKIKKDAVVFGGGFTAEDKDFFEDEGIEYHDMLMNEAFLMENAYLTAEGALKLLLENTEETLFNKTALITGYGRIAEFLSEILFSLKMKVTVVARNEVQLKTAEKKGYNTLNLNELKSLKDFDYIFNTVPSRIFNKSMIESKSKSVYFELASAPFGVDKSDFISSGIAFVYGASLPGRYFPVTSANLIAEYILKFI
mgnify:CR=1 FL=1